MSSNRGRLIITALLGLLAVPMVSAHNGVALVLGPALLFVLPGYAFASGVFGGAVMTLHERALLALSFSLSIAIICGLALNVTAVGLRPESWAGMLAAVTGAMCILAIARGGASSKSAERRGLPPPMLRHLATLAVTVALLVLAVALPLSARQYRSAPGFTQLWLTTARADDLIVGVRNEEGAASTYRIAVVVGQNTREFEVALKPGEEWRDEIQIDPGDNVHAYLYRTDHAGDGVYRWVSLAGQP